MLEVDQISKRFVPTAHTHMQEVLAEVSFTVGRGEIVSITGKSGEGKSTIARVICGLVRPDSGTVRYQGEMLVSSAQRFHPAFRRDIQLIPQQPMLALDPRQRIGDAVAEPMLAHHLAATREEAAHRAAALLEQVWLHKEIAKRYPAQISGGQAQRVVIARALGLDPKLLIADESTSMLDISAQAQVVQIFKSLREQRQMSILLISHDVALVKALSHHVYELSGGRLQTIY